MPLSPCKPSGLQDVEIIWPYLAEWDTAPYPPKFKAPILHTFDGKGSSNQHIYYFKSQTGNVVSNDTIMAHLFIVTLKGVAFKWFMKLPVGLIKNGTTSRSYFLLVSSKMIQKLQCQPSLHPSRRKKSLSKLLLKDFRAWYFAVPVA